MGTTRSLPGTPQDSGGSVAGTGSFGSVSGVHDPPPDRYGCPRSGHCSELRAWERLRRTLARGTTGGRVAESRQQTWKVSAIAASRRRHLPADPDDSDSTLAMQPAMRRLRLTWRLVQHRSAKLRQAASPRPRRACHSRSVRGATSPEPKARRAADARRRAGPFRRRPRRTGRSP
jgi:hypothetical protein